MLSFLKYHPFAVETFFESSLILTYAVPRDELKTLIPACLELDTLDDKWAFIAVAIVKAKNLRPKGFPEFIGNNVILTGYRIFVRYTTSQGKRLRGLYILKSETDKTKMTLLGNIFTHYKYTTTDIHVTRKGSLLTVQSHRSDLAIEVEWNDQDISLPPQSPFADWKAARRFAGPLPFTFTYNFRSKEVLMIEGVRENWIPQPVKVNKYNSGFIKQMGFKEIVLANAFILENIPYYWKKGKIDTWKEH